MTQRTARAVAVAMTCVLVSPVAAQNAPAVDRRPSVSYSSGLMGAYQAGSVSPLDTRNSQRLHDLVRAGQIYLSLRDAIALALENNLDLELERYSVRLAATDTLRAKGGGLLRGVSLSAIEAPAGVGGPGEPLLTSAATGVTPQTNVATNVADTQFIAQATDNLSTTGPFSLSAGPAIPQYDPALVGQFLASHATTPENSLVITGTPALISNTVASNVGYSQGFSPGTQVIAGFQNLRTDANSVRNLLNPYYNSGLGVTVTQPLLRGFGIDLNRRFIRIAKNSERMSDEVFRYQAMVTVAGVVRLYTDLVSLNEDLKVKEQTLATAQRLAEDNRNKVDQGTLAPVELTRAQAQVAAATQDLVNSEGFVRQQELILKNFLTRDPASDPLIHEARIVPTDPLSIRPIPDQPAEQLVQTAYQYRPDYLVAKTQLDNTEIQLKGARNELRPQLDLVGNMSNSGLAGPGNPAFAVSPGSVAPGDGSLLGFGGGYGASLSQIFRRDYPTYSIGLNLTLPLRNRVAQADAARDEIQLRQTQVRTRQLENQIRLQVEDALITLQRTRAAYEAAVQARRLQEQSLEIETERFNVGLSTNFLVIQYQSYVAQARSAEVASMGAYSKARTQLDSVMGTILPAYNITLDEAFRGELAAGQGPK
ncbi:MAG TPA: TolC family protein [Bryobacteraceae bacterium]|nr:TolC family protein [Bryobacteraceae bacterium]